MKIFIQCICMLIKILNLREEYKMFGNAMIEEQFGKLFEDVVRRGVTQEYAMSFKDKSLDDIFDEGVEISKEIQKAYKEGKSHKEIDKLQAKMDMGAGASLLFRMSGYYYGYDIYFSDDEARREAINVAVLEAKKKGLFMENKQVELKLFSPKNDKRNIWDKSNKEVSEELLSVMKESLSVGVKPQEIADMITGKSFATTNGLHIIEKLRSGLYTVPERVQMEAKKALDSAINNVKNKNASYVIVSEPHVAFDGYNSDGGTFDCSKGTKVCQNLLDKAMKEQKNVLTVEQIKTLGMVERQR